MKKLYYTVCSLLSIISFDNFAMQIIGHRGACGYAPENTLSSFQMALDMQVDMIELDVYVCATGELVVIHDDTVDRTTNGSGTVVNMSFEQLRKLVVEGYEQIPTLQEVIELIDRKVPLNIELKGPHTAQPVAALVATYLQKGWSCDDFVISSFQHDQVALFQQFYPDIQIGLLFSIEKDINCDYVQKALLHGVNFIGLNCKLLTQGLLPVAMIQDAHDNDLLLFMYTVNDLSVAEYLNDVGINGIFSNYPDIMRF